MDASAEVSALLAPERLWSREQVLARPSPVPSAAGVYAWFFTDLPDIVPVDGCRRVGSAVLAYTGISPKRPPANGRRPSRQSLRTRVKYHYRGNAEGSTLRLTLGSLLGDRLGIVLRRVGSGTRLTFADGEGALSDWMSHHAFVTWVCDPAPWELERRLIASVDLPLNLDQNSGHPFAAELSALRARARATARALPVLFPDGGVRG